MFTRYPRKISRRWPKYLGLCHDFGDLEEPLALSFSLAHFWLAITTTRIWISQWKFFSFPLSVSLPINTFFKTINTSLKKIEKWFKIQNFQVACHITKTYIYTYIFVFSTKYACCSYRPSYSTAPKSQLPEKLPEPFLPLSWHHTAEALGAREEEHQENYPLIQLTVFLQDTYCPPPK